jgi:hypothetical protein
MLLRRDIKGFIHYTQFGTTLASSKKKKFPEEGKELEYGQSTVPA